MKNKNTSWAFFFLTVVLFSIGWLFVYRLFYLEYVRMSWFIVMLFFLATVFLGLFLIVSQNKKLEYLIILFGTILSLILAKNQFLIMSGVWLVGLALFVVGVKKIKKEKESRRSIDVYMILKRGIPVIATALSILIAGGFYFSLVEKRKLSAIPKIDIEIPETFTTKALKVVRFVIPTDELVWIQDGITVDEYVEKTLQRNNAMFKDGIGTVAEEAIFEKNLSRLEINDLSEIDKQKLIEGGRDLLSVQLGVSLEGDEKMILLVNQLLEKRAEEFLNGDTVGTELLPIGAALAVLILLQTVTWILGFAALWTATGLFAILVRLNLIKISTVSKQVEQII
ncbi:MAG: hypothetical protein U9O20_04720 [Patescibacteria group bacterium]|nr:hypothetical protein [Patescibacteria group bacterium]